MKCNKFLVKGIFTTVLAFSFVLTACDIGNENNLTPEDLAAKLAADINRMKGEGWASGDGKATANGSTVTITGGFAGISKLTVPEGVTLDLTADGRLGLGNQNKEGIEEYILTVNGTIITNAGNIGMEDCTAEATINGSGTIRLNSNGNIFSGVSGNWNANPRKLILDGVMLVGQADNDQALVYVGKGGELVMKRGAITGNGGLGVVIQEGGTVNNPYDNNNIVTFTGGKFTMEGGTISGNSGGVHIITVGGSHIDSWTNDDGTSITVAWTNDSSKGTGTFTMNSPAVAGASGNISGNAKSGTDNNVYNDGGTVNGSANPNPDSITNGLLW